ncbi:MAG: transcription termination factor NusA [Candidatus Cloacimonadota bacterium]|nr:MAG: transcription termination factor NusA [Candidatus Cloacimonadota bacterium]
MSGNLVASLNELATLKQLDRGKLTEIIKESLYQAVSKKLLPENGLEIFVDFSSNQVKAKFNRFVVEQDNTLGEISLRDAKKHNAFAQIGDEISVSLDIQDFEPKIIKNARKSIQEKIKQLEEDRIMFDYEKQKNQIVSGKITKADYTGYTVNIGYGEALLPSEEQVEDEFYKVGDVIRSYVVNIRKTKKKVIIILSRTHPEFVKKLFESEIPEIFSGDIEVKKIVREPGMRTKVCVNSKDSKIDPAGSCLGPKGIRIEQIRKELHGEQIDIVVWSDSPEQLIANAIGSDLTERVYLAERGKFARIIVQAGNKNSAIGKKGKNVKLAAKLTDYKLDIFTEEEFEEKISEERRITSHVIELDGVTEKIAETLKAFGYTSVQDIFEASKDELCKLDGVGEKTAGKIKESADNF